MPTGRRGLTLNQVHWAPQSGASGFDALLQLIEDIATLLDNCLQRADENAPGRRTASPLSSRKLDG
jgi:hypothetical protein